MQEVIVFVEGQSEEQFIKQIVAPVFRQQQIFLKPQMLNTSKNAKGGGLSFDRFKFNAKNTLKQYPNAVLTTFFDLYQLDTGFPSFNAACQCSDVYERVDLLEKALHTDVTSSVGCRSERFIPYIQPYELEGLWFSDVEQLVQVEPNWANSFFKLQKERDGFLTPEHINGSYETKPSKRLGDALSPKFKKTLHTVPIAERVTLTKIELECKHFKKWMDKIRTL